MNYLIIDLHTTGDDPSWHDIVHLSACLCKSNWSEVSTYESMIYPKDEDAFTLLTNQSSPISISDLKEAPLMFDAIDAFETWLIKQLGVKPNPDAPEEAFEEVIICGHNLVSNYSFLRLNYGDENKDWKFNTLMLDLSTLSHLYFSQTKASNNTFSSKLNSIAKALDLSYEEDLGWELERIDLIRKVFQEISQRLRIV